MALPKLAKPDQRGHIALPPPPKTTITQTQPILMVPMAMLMLDSTIKIVLHQGLSHEGGRLMLKDLNTCHLYHVELLVDLGARPNRSMVRAHHH